MLRHATFHLVHFKAARLRDMTTFKDMIEPFKDTIEHNAQTAEIVPPDSPRGIYEEALAELVVNERDQAKEVIKKRLLEIKRMETCLEKAKADLAKMLKKEVSEIAML